MSDDKHKMDAMLKELLEIKVSLAEIKVDLAHHIRRSDKHERSILIMVVVFSMLAGMGAKWLAPFLRSIL